MPPASEGRGQTRGHSLEWSDVANDVVRVPRLAIGPMLGTFQPDVERALLAAQLRTDVRTRRGGGEVKLSLTGDLNGVNANTWEYVELHE